MLSLNCGLECSQLCSLVSDFGAKALDSGLKFGTLVADLSNGGFQRMEPFVLIAQTWRWAGSLPCINCTLNKRFQVLPKVGFEL